MLSTADELKQDATAPGSQFRGHIEGILSPLLYFSAEFCFAESPKTAAGVRKLCVSIVPHAGASLVSKVVPTASLVRCHWCGS